MEYFYADSARPVQKKTFTESIFAEDLNCFKNFARNIGNEYVLRQIQGCQKEVHAWGHANKVIFDLAKEHALILDPQHPYGEFFEILGVQFDIKLVMHAEVSRTASEASRRCHIILKLRRFYDVKALFRLFKAHVLSYIERSTPAIFHCSPSILCLLDNVQLYFLDANIFKRCFIALQFSSIE